MTIEQEFPMVHRFHSREGCGARTLTSTLRLGWEEMEPPSNRDGSRPGLASIKEGRKAGT